MPGPHGARTMAEPGGERTRRATMSLTVSQWRFCVRCHSMFHDGSTNKGACGAGGGHQAMGYDFDLGRGAHDAPNLQSSWRMCGKCRVLFFDGYADKGRCQAGGGHV